jgi:DNA-binding helix-hairpin-helix protein with protein kinase domain
VVRDIEGRCYRLGELLGQGTQGAVYAVANDPEVVVKVRAPRRPDQDQLLRQRLRVLALRKLCEAMITKPQAVLDSPHLGYVMRRAETTATLADLFHPGREETAAWFQKSGGLRHRLRLGADLARALEHLHGEGLCYVDLSPGNVLVAGDATDCRVRLIDPDNLTVPGTSQADVLGTPWFIAPEVVRDHHPPDHASDRWSLAVLLYYLLVLHHPFFGDPVVDGDPEQEEVALRGEKAYIDNPRDSSNRSRFGWPRERVLSPGLRALFLEAFTAGLEERWARPSPRAWREALLEAADTTALCRRCGASSYLPQGRKSSFDCPWCGQPSPAPIEIVFRAPVRLAPDEASPAERKEIERGRQARRFVVDKGQQFVPARLTEWDADALGRTGRFGLRERPSGGRYAVFVNVSGAEWSVRTESGQTFTVGAKRDLCVENRQEIAFASGVTATVYLPLS